MRYALQQLVKNGKPEMYYHWNSDRADLYKSKADSTENENEKLRYRFLHWTELLNAGQTETCIDSILQFLQFEYQGLEFPIDASNKPILDLLAAAYLRQGEVENCLANHAPSSCIIPFRPEAIHLMRSGSENAIYWCERILNSFPGDSQTKWLLTIAHMTLGSDLDTVRSNFVVKFPNWDLERRDFPRFRNIGMAAGCDITGLSGGVCIEDFNGDGYLDIFATSYGMEDPVRLLINDGKGKFQDKSIDSGLRGIISGLNAVHADYDNDGFRDILVLRGGWLGKYGTHPNSLLKNMGDGSFRDVTFSAGLDSRLPTQTAAWADFDRDGFLDLFVGNESGEGLTAFCELYKNDGNGSFNEVGRSVGLSKLGVVKGVAWGDFNNDLWPDLYISCLGGQNSLFKNIRGTFEEVTQSAGVQDPEFSFPCWFWDYDNDGWQDILVASYDMRAYTNVSGIYFDEINNGELFGDMVKLYRNNGDETFTDVAHHVGLDKIMHAMGSNFGDLDNDGFQDFYIGTGAPNLMSIVPNRMFRNVRGKFFEEVTSAGGFGHLQKGHAVGFGDMDNDGDQDIYSVIGGAYEGDVFQNVLFENPGFGNDWISLELRGQKSNRDGIGARIAIEVESGDSIKIFHHAVSTGGSFGSSSLRAEMGLGNAQFVKSMTIHWPSGDVQVFHNIEANQFYRASEGQERLLAVDVNRFQFSTDRENNKQHH